ncbi:hypothetical protein OROHE_013020 [Orobanche hederae]
MGKNGFTIHGGWPSPKTFEGPFFYYDRLKENKKLIEELNVVWPNNYGKDNHMLWGHEWNTHGRYCDMDQMEYFEPVVEVVRPLNLPNAAAYGGYGASYAVPQSTAYGTYPQTYQAQAFPQPTAYEQPTVVAAPAPEQTPTAAPPAPYYTSHSRGSKNNGLLQFLLLLLLCNLICRPL